MSQPMHASSKKRAEKKIQTAQKAAAGAAIAAAFLAVGKLTLFATTGSLVIGLSAWDSTVDVAISLLNRKIIHFARQDADFDHPYGHGKAESIAAMGQGVLILGGAVAIFFAAMQKFYKSTQHTEILVEHSWYTVSFFIAAAFISGAVTFWLKYYGKKFQSPALLADSEHYRVDVISHAGSAAAIALMLLTHKSWLDPLVASIVAIYIGKGSLSLLKESVNELMDHDVSDSLKTRILEIVAACDNRIIDVHKFRGRKSGHRYFFDFHITLPSTMAFVDVHLVVDEIEEKLLSEFDADVVVHADPESEKTAASANSIAFSRAPQLAGQ